MSINQLLITAFIATLFGIFICITGAQILDKLKKYYYKITFKHEVLEPYTPKKNIKGNK